MEITNKKHIQLHLQSCFQIYDQYSWLLDNYVLDFFTENHWSKLTESWQTSLKDLGPQDLANLLDYDQPLSNKVWPLSLIALKTLLVRYSLSRKITDLNINGPYFKNDQKLLKWFWKNVKAKKRHEISIMSKICYKSANDMNCFYIVDIGSGLGHLSRMLSFGYNFKVCAIEARQDLSEQAIKLDFEFEKALKKLCQKYTKSIHVNLRIKSDITENEFLAVIKKAFNIQSDCFKFGIVGLHPCGDLGTTLLRLYSNCDNAKYINIVGCCYMKLSSTVSSLHQGFPLSQFCKNRRYDLSYHSKEIACHAIENYVTKLVQGECWKLKIHMYRALIEKIIVDIKPELHHSALSNVKYTEDLTFRRYCQKAITKLKLNIPDDCLADDVTGSYLKQWKNVVVFYSLRLLLAPIIETIILLDRLLYVVDSGTNKCAVIPVFNSSISPRNHVLCARKL